MISWHLHNKRLQILYDGGGGLKTYIKYEWQFSKPASRTSDRSWNLFHLWQEFSKTTSPMTQVILMPYIYDLPQDVFKTHITYESAMMDGFQNLQHLQMFG